MAKSASFDSLVQMSAGIADAGMRTLGKDRPTPLPVQALDHATGYLMAALVVRGLTQRIATGRGSKGGPHSRARHNYWSAGQPVKLLAILAAPRKRTGRNPSKRRSSGQPVGCDPHWRSATLRCDGTDPQ